MNESTACAGLRVPATRQPVAEPSGTFSPPERWSLAADELWALSGKCRRLRSQTTVQNDYLDRHRTLEKTMFNKLSTLLYLISSAMAFNAGAPAFAADPDYCIDQGGGVVSGTYVARNFNLPKAGECVKWEGFCASGCSPDNVQSGVACTSSDGKHVSFGLTTFYLASNRQFDWIRLDLPNEKGSGNLNYENPALGTTNYTATGRRCGGVSAP